MRFFISLFMLAACSTPSVSFWGVDPTRVTVEGYVFDVRVKGNVAEALRINRMKLRDRHVIYSYGAEAMERVSGCKVMAGMQRTDPTLMQAKLRC